jgi:hypothetical protein
VTIGTRKVLKPGLVFVEGFSGDGACFLTSVFTLENVIGFSSDCWLERLEGLCYKRIAC